jgi:hypothetical protein
MRVPTHSFYAIIRMYLICPDVLRAVGETSCGIRVGFIETDIVFTIFVFICI